jgi:hypothetical protein
MTEITAESSARSPVERLILERFREKTHLAGGAKAGYVLRRHAIRAPHPEIPDAEFDAAFSSLLAGGLLAANEASPVVFLTEAGVEAVRELPS